MNQERSHPVSAHILMLSHTRVIPPLNVRIFSLLLKVFQSVDEIYPSIPDVACARENTPVRLLYESGQSAERAFCALSFVK